MYNIEFTSLTTFKCIVKVKVAQSFLTLCDPTDYTVHGILQARILEWVAFPFSRGSSQPRSPALKVDSLPVEPQGKTFKCVVVTLGIFIVLCNHHHHPSPDLFHLLN